MNFIVFLKNYVKRKKEHQFKILKHKASNQIGKKKMKDRIITLKFSLETTRTISPKLKFKTKH